MKLGTNSARALAIALAFWAMWLAANRSNAQKPAPVDPPDAAAIIRGIDAAVQSRSQSVAGFTDIEHYAVFRGNDETHPAAEMTVRDTFQKGSGKTYTILSESGSGIILKFGLHPLLQNEQDINDPARIAQSLFVSANYEMKLRSGSLQNINGRPCYALTISPRREAPNMIDGVIWVDAKDYTLVKVQGVASKSPSPFAGTTHMMRQYVNVDGFSMAAHARAESGSFLFGRTVVVIDYTDYHLQTKPRV